MYSEAQTASRHVASLQFSVRTMLKRQHMSPCDSPQLAATSLNQSPARSGRECSRPEYCRRLLRNIGEGACRPSMATGCRRGSFDTRTSCVRVGSEVR